MGDNTTANATPANADEKEKPAGSRWRKIVSEQLDKIVSFIFGWLFGLLTTGAQEITSWIDDTFFNPTEARVVGEVVRQGNPYHGVVVMLRRGGGEISHQTTTDSKGAYAFDGVDDGLYRLEVSDNQTMLFSLNVFVDDGVTDRPVERIEIAADVAVVPGPMPTADAGDDDDAGEPPGTPGASIPEQSPPPDVAPTLFPGVAPEMEMTVLPAPTIEPTTVATPGATAPSVEIVYEAAPDTLAQGEVPLWVVRAGIAADVPMDEIASVTWHLNPAFQPSVVTRYAAEDFIIDFRTPGSFEIGAMVVFTDGTQVFLTEQLVLEPAS